MYLHYSSQKDNLLFISLHRIKMFFQTRETTIFDRQQTTFPRFKEKTNTKKKQVLIDTAVQTNVSAFFNALSHI